MHELQDTKFTIVAHSSLTRISLQERSRTSWTTWSTEMSTACGSVVSTIFVTRADMDQAMQWSHDPWDHTGTDEPKPWNMYEALMKDRLAQEQYDQALTVICTMLAHTRAVIDIKYIVYSNSQILLSCH